MFKIRYTDGRTLEARTYEEALGRLEADCAEIGHDGDLSEGGDRTLAWLTAEDAQDDAGARAYAVIERV